MSRRLRGDGGIDNVLIFNGVPHVVDVKTARLPFNLIVEVGKVKPKTIYILAGYSDEHKNAVALGWEWGIKLLRAPTKDFGYGVINHYIPRENLRGIDELLRKREADPVVHRCHHCGELACWGFDVSLRHEKEGVWFCFEHRLMYDAGKVHPGGDHGEPPRQSDPHNHGGGRPGPDRTARTGRSARTSVLINSIARYPQIKNSY